MSKINLLEVPAGSVNASPLNQNAGIIQDAFENTLSRNGSVPNEMQANLDMNSHRVINVGLATSPSDAVPLQQMVTLGTGFAGVAFVGQGTGISVDPTNPSMPIVSLSTPALDALNLAITSAQEAEPYLTFDPDIDLPNARQLVAGPGIAIDFTPGLATIHSDGLIDHGTLTGLADDDHPQYTEHANAETVTGEWTFDNNVVITAGRELHIGYGTSIGGRALGVAGNTAGASSALIARFSNNDLPAELSLFKSHTDLVGSSQLVSDNDGIGEIVAYGANGTGYDTAAKIRFAIDGVPGAVGDMPGRITFWTTPDNAAALVERLRIASNGNITFYTHAASQTIYVGWSDALSIGGLEASLMANGVNMRVDHKVGVATTFQADTFSDVGTLHNKPAVYARVLTWTGAAPLTLTGIAPAAPGQVLVICNSNTLVNNITLSNEDAGSLPQNRFALPNATNANIQRGGSARLWYNPATLRWAAFGVS